SRRTSLRALRSSSVLATHTVQVTNEAKASPIITAFTTRSEFSNMPQGERSSGRSAPLIMCSPGSAAEAGAAGALDPPDGPPVGACADWFDALGAMPVAEGAGTGAVPCPV